MRAGELPGHLTLSEETSVKFLLIILLIVLVVLFVVPALRKRGGR